MSTFWQGKHVFLTGHTGFKGAWLSYWLTAHLGARVTGFALKPPSTPALFDIIQLQKIIDDIRGDVRDLDALTKAMQTARPDIVIHMAAQSLVRASYSDPVGTYGTNVMGTAHLLEAVRSCDSVRAVLVVTSDKCYENLELDRAYSEADAMGGYDPYSSSKGAAELVTSAYRNSFFNPTNYTQHGVAVASARAGNVIGGGDFAQDRLIPDTMRAFMANTPLISRYPDAIRPWQHVLDPLAGYLLLCERLTTDGAVFAEAWNFGPYASSEQPVRAVLDQLCQCWGGNARWQHQPQSAPHEAHYLKLNCSKAQARLGWQPHFDLAQSLRLTVDWYRAYAQKAEVTTLMNTQIRLMDTKAS